MARKLTERQSQVLETIKVLTSQLGMPPTLAEITEAFPVQMTQTAIRDHTKALIKKGYVVDDPGKPRSLRAKTLAIAEADIPILSVGKGDYCHFTGGKLTAITRPI
jgi:SOS-response transcriptional repressor LexA